MRICIMMTFNFTMRSTFKQDGIITFFIFPMQSIVYTLAKTAPVYGAHEKATETDQV